ncbi:Uncharacterised protein [uncultured archaeon]|nr:Uncharacterised protein [uncultured archaeon]
MQQNFQFKVIAQSPVNSDLVASSFKPGLVVGAKLLADEKKFWMNRHPSGNSREFDFDPNGELRKFPTREVPEYHRFFGGEFNDYLFSKICCYNADTNEPFRLLDIGIGKTPWQQWFRTNQFDRRAVDFKGTSLNYDTINPAMLEYCVFSNASSLHRFYPPESFDFISSNLGVHYEEFSSLEVILYLLKTGGEAMVTFNRTRLPVFANQDPQIYKVLGSFIECSGPSVVGFYHIKKTGPYRDVSSGVDPDYSFLPVHSEPTEEQMHQVISKVLATNPEAFFMAGLAALDQLLNGE